VRQSTQYGSQAELNSVAHGRRTLQLRSTEDSTPGADRIKRTHRKKS
jgi:hypothetical protein